MMESAPSYMSLYKAIVYNIYTSTLMESLPCPYELYLLYIAAVHRSRRASILPESVPSHYVLYLAAVYSCIQ